MKSQAEVEAAKKTELYKQLYAEMTTGASSGGAMHAGTGGWYRNLRNPLAEQIATEIVLQFGDATSLSPEKIDDVKKGLVLKLSEFKTREATAEAFGWPETKDKKGHSLQDLKTSIAFATEVKQMSSPLCQALYSDMTQGAGTGLGGAMHGGLNGRNETERNALAKEVALRLSAEFEGKNLTQEQFSAVRQALDTELGNYPNRDVFASAFRGQAVSAAEDPREIFAMRVANKALETPAFGKAVATAQVQDTMSLGQQRVVVPQQTLAQEEQRAVQAIHAREQEAERQRVQKAATKIQSIAAKGVVTAKKQERKQQAAATLSRTLEGAALADQSAKIVAEKRTALAEQQAREREAARVAEKEMLSERDAVMQELLAEHNCLGEDFASQTRDKLLAEQRERQARDQEAARIATEKEALAERQRLAAQGKVVPSPVVLDDAAMHPQAEVEKKKNRSLLQLQEIQHHYKLVLFLGQWQRIKHNYNQQY